MVLSLASNDDNHAGDYSIKIDVYFADFPSLHRNSVDLAVKLKPNCRTDTFSAPTWISSGTVSIV